MAGESLVADEIIVACAVTALGLGEVVGVCLHGRRTIPSCRRVAAVDFATEQVSAAIGVAGHIVGGSLVAGLDDVAGSGDGGHARGDDGITTQCVGLIGGSGVFDKELDIAIGNRHIESTGHCVIYNSVIKRCREIIGVPGLVEHEVRTAGRHCRIAAEGQEHGPHRACIAVFQV